MAEQPPTLTLTQLRFGFQTGVREMSLEEDGVMSVDYSIRPSALATLELAGGGLAEPCQLVLKVPLGEDGLDGAVARTREETRAFLARLGRAVLDLQGGVAELLFDDDDDDDDDDDGG